MEKYIHVHTKWGTFYNYPNAVIFTDWGPLLPIYLNDSWIRMYKVTKFAEESLGGIADSEKLLNYSGNLNLNGRGIENYFQFR